MKYDAIIAGASFAGLAVARHLKGNILLIDRKAEIGDGQTSTCCVHHHFVKKLDCEDAVLQKIDAVILHVDARNVVYRLNFPFATIDYKKFCQLFFKNSQVKFLSAKILGLEKNKVLTDKGGFESGCIVDSTGWQAVLAGSIENNFVKQGDRSFGIETLPQYKNNAIEIWVNPKVMPKGVTWIFPCGNFSRVGIASYLGNTKIKEGLEDFLKKFNLTTSIDEVGASKDEGATLIAINNELHGGFFPHRLRAPVVGNIFLVGDSAGQCLPLTGEGIRPAVYFGQKCGRIIQQIIEGKKTLKEGQDEYKKFTLRKKKYYTACSILEKSFSNLPNFFAANFSKFVNLKPVFRYVEKKYVDLANF